MARVVGAGTDGGHRRERSSAVPRPTARVLVCLVAALMAGLVVAGATGLLTGSPVGAADNGDGIRTYCAAGLVPATPSGRSNWVGGAVLDFTAGGAPCPDPVPSSATALLTLAAGDAAGPWSLTTLGWHYLLLVSLVAALAAWAATAAGLVRALVLVPVVLPLASSDFSRFFLSTYGEPAGLLGAVTLCAGAAALMVTRRGQRGARWTALLVVSAGGIVAATAKTAYAPLLLLAVGVCAVTAVTVSSRRRWLDRVPGPVVAAAALLVSVAPLSAALDWQSRGYPAVNTHNVVFTLVLTEVGPGAAAPLGLPDDAAAYAGRAYYPDGPAGVPGAELIAADPDAVRNGAWTQLLMHPGALARAVGTALQATQGRELTYLRSAPWTSQTPLPRPDPPVGEQGATADGLNGWLDGMPLPWWPTLLVVLGIAAGAAAGLARSACVRGLLRLSAVAATGALGLAVVAVLGDGYFEIAKHVWLAAYLLDVTTVALAGGVVLLVGAHARAVTGNRSERGRMGGERGSLRRAGVPAVDGGPTGG